MEKPAWKKSDYINLLSYNFDAQRFGLCFYTLSRDVKNFLHHVPSEGCSEGSDEAEGTGISPAQEQCVPGGRGLPQRRSRLTAACKGEVHACSPDVDYRNLPWFPSPRRGFQPIRVPIGGSKGSTDRQIEITILYSFALWFLAPFSSWLVLWRLFSPQFWKVIFLLEGSWEQRVKSWPCFCFLLCMLDAFAGSYSRAVIGIKAGSDNCLYWYLDFIKLDS